MSWLHVLALLGAFAFLYVPIGLLVLYSFNASRLVSVWGGFSTRWYQELAGNEQLLASTWISLRIAFCSALVATILGTAMAWRLARYGYFRGRGVLMTMILAPLVLPEVITGLALLLLFVAVDIDRGFWTVVIAHATIGMCFVTFVVWSRLDGMDWRLEEAALDLGASPAATFRQITLPLIAPAVFAGFLLAFTVSFDDFVLASFTSGPGSTTLPMRIYSQVRLGISPQINAISTLMLLAVACVLLTVLLLTRKSMQQTYNG